MVVDAMRRWLLAQTLPEVIRPPRISLESTTACQLRCPSCPTAAGTIGQLLGTKVLHLEHFKRLLDTNPWVAEVELSNWGEAFLNPEILGIIRYAHEKGVRLTLLNGSNFNTVSDEVLEALVKYRFCAIVLSIDGATQQTYEKYRIRGKLDVVLGNIRKLNQYKKQYGSDLPHLIWQYIVFDHNRHELDTARALAEELGCVRFVPKMTWDPARAPEMDETLETQSGLKATSADEHAKLKPGRRDPLTVKQCAMLWYSPQVNSDGRVLGCCVNAWQDFGNAFDTDLASVINGDLMNRTRRMLLGLLGPQDDAPCTTCEHYLQMRVDGVYLKAVDVHPYTVWLRRMFWLRRRLAPVGYDPFLPPPSLAKLQEKVLEGVVKIEEKLLTGAPAGAGQPRLQFSPWAAQSTSMQLLFDDVLPMVLARPNTPKLDLLYGFKLDGPDGGEWVIDTRATPPTCLRGKADRPDCSIEAPAHEFQSMLSSPVQTGALLSGRTLKLSGRFSAIERLFSLPFSPAA